MPSKPLTLSLLVTFIVVAVLFFANTQPGCIIRNTTSLHCPGCGGKRALSQLSDGHLLLSLQSNLLLIPALLMIAWTLVALLANGAVKQIYISKRSSIILLLIVASYTIIRNFESLSTLRP